MGTSAPNFGRYLNGLSYPTLQMMQKFEVVFGWPVTDQTPLIPYYWEWPLQKDRAEIQPTDLRYGMKLRQVVDEWTEANPRVGLSVEVRMHPALKARRAGPD